MIEVQYKNESKTFAPRRSRPWCWSRWRRSPRTFMGRTRIQTLSPPCRRHYNDSQRQVLERLLYPVLPRGRLFPVRLLPVFACFIDGDRYREYGALRSLQPGVSLVVPPPLFSLVVHLEYT